MAKLQLKAGTTSKRIKVRFRDTSDTAKNKGLTGLVFNSASLTCYYHRDGDTTPTAVTLVTATVGTFTSGGFKEVDATNLPGVYEFGIPNAALANAGHVVIVFKGATNMEEYPFEIEVTAVDNQDAAAFGMSRLDNSISSRMATFTLPANFSNLGITVGGAVTAGTVNDKTGYSLTQTFPANFSSLAITVGGAVTAGTVSDKTGYSLSQSFPTNFSALAIDVSGRIQVQYGTATGQFNAAAGNLSNVTVTTNNDKTGYSLATAPPTAAANAAAVWDLATTGHTTAGTFGSAAVSAGSAGDPWSATLPGAYGAGTAGNIVGNNLNATVSSRSTYGGADTSGTTTLLARLTNTRATNLDFLTATPPTATAIRQEIDTNSTQLASIVSSLAGMAASVWAYVTRTLSDKTGFALTSGERTSIATTVRDINNTTPAVGSLGAAINAAGGGGVGGGLALTDPVTFRAYNPATPPTVEDCLTAAWVGAYGKSDIPTTATVSTVTNGFTLYGPGASPVSMRTFTTTVETDTGTIVGRT